MIFDRSRTTAWRCWVVGPGLVVLAISGSAFAGEETAAPPTRTRTRAESTESLPGWRSFPRRARVALEAMAKRQGATVTRCVATEQDGVVTYEIHASRRSGLFRAGDDFILTQTSEPRAAADERVRQQSLRARVERLRDATLRRPAATVTSVGPGLPTP